MAASPPDCAELLRAYVSEHALLVPIDTDHDVDRRMRQIFSQRRAEEIKKDPSLSQIPRFYCRPKPDPVRSKVRKIARMRFMQRKSAELLDEDDLERLAVLLTENTSPPSDGKEAINWDQFCLVASYMPKPAVAQFFTASSFLKFRRDQWGRISTHTFFQYVCRKVALCQTRIQLSVYDSVGDGFLREQDLENYIYELIPTLPPLQNLQENFMMFYVFTAVRKFFFMLDHRRTGRVAIRDILTSSVLTELLQLRDEPWDEDDERGWSNWFSAHNALRVYSQYLVLDVDHNGMLSKHEPVVPVGDYDQHHLVHALGFTRAH